MERILYLDGTPNMTDYFKINIGQTVEAAIEERSAARIRRREAPERRHQALRGQGDNGSRELLEKILLDEEHHIDWLEGQLHAIKEMTYENYLAQQLHEG